MTGGAGRRVPQLDVPARLLMGPGPVNAHPRVLRAMATPLVGQYDPAMTGLMAEVQQLYREVFATANDATLLVDGTSRAGIEAALVSLVAPGRRVLVPVYGRFGHLLVEIARRAGAEVHTVTTPWGQVPDPGQVADEVRRLRPHLLATVHGDTSTTMVQPLDGLGEVCRETGTLFLTDATATLGGNPLPADAWGLDVVTAGLQKCLGGPSGTAPVTLSPRAVQVVTARRHVEEGLAGPDDRPGPGPRIGSNYFDLAMVLDYWGPRRLNHHTEATSALYAARECAALLVEEGPGRAVARHATAGRALAAGLGALGLQVFGDPRHRMHNVVAVHVPEGVDDAGARAALLHDYGIEIGTSFGPLAGRVWRVGAMGVNARRDAVLTTLAALEQVLRAAGTGPVPGAGVGAAREVYEEEA